MMQTFTYDADVNNWGYRNFLVEFFGVNADNNLNAEINKG
jgi:hypothetical protein